MAKLKQSKILPPQIIEMTESRVEAIKKYIELNVKYRDLYNKCLVQKFSIYREQEELDVDSLSKAQIEVLDKVNDEKQRERIMEKYPKTIVDYETHLIAPFYIGDSTRRTDSSVSQTGTKILQLINSRIEQEISPFIQFLN